MPTISGIDHVALTVRDLTVGVTFYESVLGVEPMGTITSASRANRERT